mgnify:CR=1 FL=1
MRKKALGIIGGVVLVAALGTASFFLLRNTPEEDSSSVSSSDSSEESISLTSEDPNDVTSIDITNGSGSFAVVRTAEGTGTGDDHAAYAVSGWEDLPMDTSTLWTLSNNTASMEANGVVEENCSDLEKFGLDDAEAIAVTLHFADCRCFQYLLCTGRQGHRLHGENIAGGKLQQVRNGFPVHYDAGSTGGYQ